jgi:myo-inositol-1(or 4)-monophosphatase
MAAGVLLVQEAGGMNSEISGGEKYLDSGNIVSANPDIFKEILEKIS